MNQYELDPQELIQPLLNRITELEFQLIAAQAVIARLSAAAPDVSE